MKRRMLRQENMRSCFKRAVIIITALAAGGTVLYGLWARGTFLPGWIIWEENNITDTSGDYTISLAEETVYVRYQETEVWQSPKGVKVQQVLSCDIDRDGGEELILLCWKRGRFGKYKPFWIEKDEKSWSQHIFVYDYAEDAILPQWMSSYIGQDVSEMSCGGGKDSMQWLLLTDPKGETSCWRWDSWGFTKDEAEVSFVVFGDNLIHEPIYRYGLNQGGNFDFLFEQVKAVIDKSDVSVINQETPLVTEYSEYGDYPRFGTPVQVGQAIVDAGFDVVTCATNHALDRGAKGIHTTKEYFTKQDVCCLGIQTGDEPERKPYEIIKRNNIRFALFNYTYGTNGISLPEGNPFTVHLLENEEQIRADIQKARREADMVIVFVHWGTENSVETDAFQERWTDVFLDSKADVIVGTHPHVLQDYEMLEGEEGHRMLVFYSIGNFVSAQPEKSSVKGGMAEFVIAPAPGGYEIVEYSLTPLTIRWESGGKYTPVFSGEK